MRVACSTSAWRGDLEHALARVAALGFQYVDLICIDAWDHVTSSAVTGDYDAELARIRDLLARFGLIPVAVNIAPTPQLFERSAQANEQRSTTMRAFCRLMNDLGIETGSYYPGFRQEADVFAETVESILEIAVVAAEHGVTLGPELHWQTNLESLDQARRVLAEVPELTVAYDPSHFLMQGIPVEQTRFILERSHHVHLRAAARDRMQASLAESADAIRWILASLADIGYAGDLTIEYLPSDELDPEAEIAALRDLVLSAP